MGPTLLRIYDKFILERPIVTILVTLAVVVFFVCHIPKFKLDASGDSLVLENDVDLHYYRSITDRYETTGVLVLTYSVKGDLFSSSSLNELVSSVIVFINISSVEPSILISFPNEGMRITCSSVVGPVSARQASQR